MTAVGRPEPDRDSSRRRGRGALDLGQAAPHDVRPRSEAVPRHRVTVALPARPGDAAPWPVDEGDPPVPERGEVVDRGLEALAVGCQHAGHLGRAGTPDGHGRAQRCERRQVGIRQLRSEQHQRLAAEVEQRLGGPVLVGARGGGAQDEVEPTVRRGAVERSHQLGVERAADVEQHPEQVRAPTGEQARGAVGAVAQVGRGRAHGLRGARAGPGAAAQHQRRRGRGHPGTLRDVDQPGPSGRRWVVGHVSPS